MTTQASGDPQISQEADPGEYCVQLFDQATLSAQAAFTITIVHP